MMKFLLLLLELNIKEEVYASQPLGFVDLEFPDRVYKVEKALYGLHQAPRAWYETLSTYLLDHGFRRGTIDKTLFIKKIIDDILLVQVYVDDIIFGSTKSDYAGASLDRKSATGGCQFLAYLDSDYARANLDRKSTTRGTYGMAIDYCIMKEGMSILRGQKSVLGISSSERENGKKKDQKGKYGLAKVKSWKLIESCGVHWLTLSTTQIFLLVERMYHLTHFTLEQMINDVRLEVEDESKMSLKLLKLVR
nr:reverse transcriptase [Tanacetum cinerariifolium]